MQGPEAREPLLRIGELARLAGVSPRTVDFYTNLGLVTPIRRSGGNFRLYRPQDVHRITVIRRLEAHGIRLDDIAHALRTEGPAPAACGQHPDQACPADPDAVPMHLSALEEQVQVLREVAGTVDTPTRGLLATLTARATALITTAALLGADLAAGADSLLPPL